ncbi:TetR/AcrR family transcriptional regulator [Pontivivens ytuae]|uniref:TetR/AcrR family transcriptional regulator n=1 Tax=Pontivivens ytuae TaxID=2789856 RepID=A0A7S9LRW0_9RHOB|nr:TetR/AcrR family transcriptional regulator [Pontivivens ytuae]QPH53845.1 TetR/AcrR family transcriptional regulator [Pontivivens ytuae]
MTDRTHFPFMTERTQISDVDEGRPGRPRSFEEGDVLARALDTFRAHGFHATTYPMLEEATGLHRQSLRYAFGDKAALFAAALNAYATRRLAEVDAALAAPDTAEALQRLTAIFRRDAADAAAPGCLLVRSLAEMDLPDPLRAAARATSDRIEARIADRLGAGQAAGEVRADLPSAALARQILLLADGAMVHAAAGDPPDAALAALPTLVLTKGSPS